MSRSQFSLRFAVLMLAAFIIFRSWLEIIAMVTAIGGAMSTWVSLRQSERNPAIQQAWDRIGARTFWLSAGGGLALAGVIGVIVLRRLGLI